MRNYQQQNYRHYYTLSPDGIETEVSRQRVLCSSRKTVSRLSL